MTVAPFLAPDSVRRVRLRNGLTVLLRRDDSAPVVAIVTYVKAGYFDETDDVVGIAHVLEHMYFKGTPTRGVGEISRETKAAGGYLNAGTIYDHTSYYTVLPASSAVRGLEIQWDAYANSLIDAAELSRELEVIIQEAKRKADSPAAVAIESLYELLFDAHRMRRWRIGREPGLRRLGRAELTGFYRNFYQPHETILVIVGDIDPDAMACEVERLYGPLPDAPVSRAPGPAEPPHEDFRYRELDGDITQTHFAIGWRTPGTLHPDTALLDIAGTVLGSGRASRLYRAVRERKLVTSISAYNYTPTELGVFTVSAEGPPPTAGEALRTAWAHVADLHDRGLRSEELERARRLFEARWVRRLETMEGQANYLAEWEALGDWVLGERYLERLLTADAAAVTAAVRTHLRLEGAGVLVYRPASAPPLAASAPAMRQQLERADAEPLAPIAMRAPAVSGSAAAPRLEREEGRVRVYRTARDVPILVRRRDRTPLVHLGVYVAGGASEEPEEVAGLTSLLTRTAIKGTARRTAAQLAEDAELLGGSLGASAGAESFGWGISVPSKHVLAALDLLGDVVQHATIPDAALDTERALAIADLELLRDDMYRYPLRLLTQAAFAGHPYGVPASGHETTLAAVDADRVRAWHLTHVLSGTAVIAIVGDLDPDDAAAAAATQFAALRLAPPGPLAAPAWPAAPITAHESRLKAQTALAMAFAAPSRTDDARFVSQLLAGVASGLGGRFFEELRDRRSLAYTVQAFASERRLAGMFVTYIATSPEKEEIARRGVLDEFAKLRDAPVSDAELAQAQAYAIGAHAIRQQSGGSVLADLVDAWMFGRGLRELDEFESQVRAVTPRVMQELARRYFDASRTVNAVVRGVGKVV